MAIAFKRSSLSQKEQEAKNRFYGLPPQQSSPPTKDKPQKEQKRPSQSNQQQLQIPSQQQKDGFEAAYNAPSNEQIDQFYKNIENDFKQVAQKQVTMGMLVSQQELMKQQQEILMRNQQQMQQFTQQNNTNSNNNKQNSNNQGEQQMMMNLLTPINQQLQEIKQLYQQTQQSQSEIRQQLQQQNSNINFQQYDSQNNQLKQLLDTTQHNLQFLRPENLQTLQNFTNFNLQLYQDTINNLQNQIFALQNEAATSEQELHVKYKQLNDAHMVRKIQKVSQYEEETIQQLEKQINSINYEKSQQYINQKLGGFFDYEQFSQDISDITAEASIVYSSFVDKGLDYEMYIPEYQFDSSDIEALNNKPSSILDEMKAALGITNKPPPPKPKQVQQPPVVQPIQPLGEMQKKTLKPNHLVNLPTKPIEPPKDIKFEKQQTPQDYKPIFKEPPRQQQQQSAQKSQKQKPFNMEKAEFRQKPKQVEDESKKYGVIEYLQNDQSFEEPKYQISYKKKDNQETNNNYDNKTRQKQNQQLISPLKQQVEEAERIQENNVYINKPQDYKDVYNYQEVKYNYQEQVNDPKFINYDDLIYEVQQTNNFTSQEQKSGALLERLGMKQENPKNEFELIELLSRDIVKDKLVQQKQLNVQAQEMINKDKILKNQSIQIQPDQPNLQDQIAMGAQAFFQGLLTAFNQTLNQVNDGISGNAAQQARQLIKIQQQLESSEYTDTEEEEARQNQEYHQKQEKLLDNQISGSKQKPNRPAPFQNTQVLQQYTFASTFSQQQQQQQQTQQQLQQPKEGGQKGVNDMKNYLNQFALSDNSQVSQNKSGTSYAGSIFRLDDSYGHKSEGQVSINEGKGNKQRGQVTKDIFKDLNQDLSDSDVPQHRQKFQ
ncbi:unnamed protein product [Paramecium octaurelia]|uniref:Uncharacterized protein n=1 Tax=Paramecium octaurelia TaxID=43137 RepID=A0A8S1T5N4_PAROT|nr:unnamed protein product [Paramecium octaurelia]